MLRTALLYAGPAALVATGWLRLEERAAAGSAALLVGLALVPALAPSARGRAAAAGVAILLAIWHVFGLSPRDAGPFDDERAYFGPFLSGLRDGFLGYYDVPQPFDPGDQPLMHAVLLVAIFGFCLALALTLADRRPLAAGLLLVAGAMWPVTLVPRDGDLLRGALVLAAFLAILAAGGRGTPRAFRPALVAGAVLVLAATAAGTMPAVAKGEFLGWRDWDFYDRPADPVGVDYVWDANYRGIEFPKEKTTVLTVTGPRRIYNWRAGTLDTFVGDRWIEDAPAIDTAVGFRQLSDPLLPPQARDRSEWVEARVKIDALRDDHLVSPGIPVAYDTGGIGIVEHRVGGAAVVGGGLERDDAYTVWGFAPRPRPQELARVRPARDLRGTADSRYLEVGLGAPTLPFGAEGREERLELLFGSPELAVYERLYETAKRVVGRPRRPYAAVAALEAWFRRGGGFTYDEQPPQTADSPPLVAFVTGHQRGYCQQFAGAMTLMLRYLGIPARVAFGFLPGSYDSSERRWTVTDHDAHTWVEVWFEGWGWLPFDPTPTRGGLAAPYSTASGSASAISAIGAIIAQEAARGGGGFESPFGRAAEGTQGSPLARDIPGEAAATISEETDRTGSLLKLVLLVAAALVGLIRLAKLGRRLLRLLPRDPRRIAAVCRRELADYLLDQGVAVPRSATARELGRAVESRLFVDAGPFVAAVGAARFGDPELATAAARRARRELRLLLRSARSQLGTAARVRGAVSPRSLGL